MPKGRRRLYYSLLSLQCVHWLLVLLWLKISFLNIIGRVHLFTRAMQSHWCSMSRRCLLSVVAVMTVSNKCSFGGIICSLIQIKYIERGFYFNGIDEGWCECLNWCDSNRIKNWMTDDFKGWKELVAMSLTLYIFLLLLFLHLLQRQAALAKETFSYLYGFCNKSHYDCCIGAFY